MNAFFFSLFALPLVAELSLENLTLARAEEIALEYNKQLLIAKEGVVEAKERKLQAISRWLPSLHFDAIWSQFERKEYLFDVYSNILPLSKNAYHSGFTLDQPVFSSDLLFRLKARQYEERSADRDQVNTVNELLLALRDRYYSVILYELALGIQRQNVDYLSEALDQEHMKLEAGNSTTYEVNQSKVAVANAISLYYETLKNLKTARNALIITLGVDPNLEPKLSLKNREIPLFSVPTIAFKMEKALMKFHYQSSDFPTIKDVLDHIKHIEDARRLTLFTEGEVLEYVELALKQRPDLARSCLEIKVAEQKVWEKVGHYFPKVGGFAHYIYNESEPGPKPFFKEKYYFSGGLSLSWNLFDSFLREHEVREASSQKRAAKIAYTRDLQAIEVQVRDSLYQFEEALYAFLSSQNGAMLAEQARYQAADKLAFGRIPPLEYRDSVNQLAMACNLRNKASTQLMMAYYQLRYAIGQDVSP